MKLTTTDPPAKRKYKKRGANLVCGKCGKKCASPQGRGKHEATCKGAAESPSGVWCPSKNCGQQFDDRGELKKHMKEFHGL